MLSLEHINLRRGPELLLEDAGFVLHKGARVGLVGKNGSGKSSLFKLILGELEPDGGELNRPTDWRLAMMAQEVPALEQAAVEYVLDGHQGLQLGPADEELEEQGEGAVQFLKSDIAASGESGSLLEVAEGAKHADQAPGAIAEAVAGVTAAEIASFTSTP